METVIQPKWNTLSLLAFVICSLAGKWIAQNPAPVIIAEFPKLHIETQKAQIKELLQRAPQALNASQEIESSGREFIYNEVQSSLPNSYRSQAPLIAKTLIEEANHWGLDPIFLLAVIKTESHFNPRAKGRKGDMGLMQLLPKTGEWVAKRLKWGNTKIDLYNPITNIKIGAAHFAQLRKHFANVGSRYLSAYNMGTRNVHRLLSQAVEPKIYATRVLKNYRELYASWSAKMPAQKRVMISLND